MSSRQHILILVIAAPLSLVLGLWLLSWPNYREAVRTQQQITRQQKQLDSLPGTTAYLAKLAAHVGDAQSMVASTHKTIPNSPNIADLIRTLSFPVDGVTLRDQTFTAGQPGPAAPGHELPFEVMPLEIEIQGSFETMIALIRSAESMDRLIRVSSVQISHDKPPGRSDRTLDTSTIEASIGLGAVYLPPPDPGEEQ